MKLSHVSDQDVLHRVGKLVGSHRELTAELVAYLAEIEARGLHLVAGFSSLFEFCLKGLRMSEGEAYRRMTAARVSRRFPIVVSLLASGAVHLSALELLRDRLTDANHAELLEAASGKTKREIERLLAARFPRPDVPDRIHPLPSPDTEIGSAPARIQPLSDGRFKVEFTAGAALCDKLELARDLLSHANPSRALEVVFERALDVLIDTLERRKLGKTKRARRNTSWRDASAGDPSGQSRVTQATRREVAARDGLCCTYISPGGRRCTARAFLELDHVQPRALGGGNHAANLRTYCRAHNMLWAERCFGREHVADRRNFRQQQRQTGAAPEAEPTKPASSAMYDKLGRVLTNLGFRAAESRRIVNEVAMRHRQDSSPATLEALVREALRVVDIGTTHRRGSTAPRANRPPSDTT